MVPVFDCPEDPPSLPNSLPDEFSPTHSSSFATSRDVHLRFALLGYKLQFSA
jgi:hypothetical protein